VDMDDFMDVDHTNDYGILWIIYGYVMIDFMDNIWM
jgi:hypothetical protein